MTLVSGAAAMRRLACGMPHAAGDDDGAAEATTQWEGPPMPKANRDRGSNIKRTWKSAL